MKLNNVILSFMCECLRCEEVAKSWGMTQIHISTNKLSFHVCGFNYQGEIEVCADHDNLSLMSSKGQICITNRPDKAVKLLDRFIELNETEYRRLYDFLQE